MSAPVSLVESVRAKVEREIITNRVLEEVAAERVNQHEKWGEQNHPMIGGFMPTAHQREYARQASQWKTVNDLRVDNETLGFDGIALEEVFEALEQDDPLLQREELVQAAAVLVAMIEALDRKPIALVPA